MLPGSPVDRFFSGRLGNFLIQGAEPAGSKQAFAIFSTFPTVQLSVGALREGARRKGALVPLAPLHEL